MSIASGFTKMKNYILTSSGYKLLSRWTSSQTVHMGDGTDDTDTVENRFGAIKGITSSLATDNDEYALSASAGKNLQDQCTQLNQSLTNFETGEIEFVGTVDKTKTGTSGYVVKNGNIVIVSFEFSFKTGYPFNGNAQIGILPFKAKHASYCGFACNLNNNQMASIYVKGSSIFLQTNNTIQENVTLRGGIIYFS